MLNQLCCRADVLTHVFELSMETSAEGCLQGADTREDNPIKVTGVLVGNFRGHPEKVPESCFMGVSQIQFKPLKGTTSTPVSFIGEYRPGADARFEDHHATCCNVPLLYILSRAIILWLLILYIIDRSKYF